jgi:hypothetical protein
MHPTFLTKCAYVEPNIGRVSATGAGAGTEDFDIRATFRVVSDDELTGRGLRSFTFQLKGSALCGSGVHLGTV